MITSVLEDWRSGGPDSILSPIEKSDRHGFIVPCLNWRSPQGIASIFHTLHGDRFTIRPEFDSGPIACERDLASRLGRVRAALWEYQINQRASPQVYLLFAPRDEWRAHGFEAIIEDLNTIRRIHSDFSSRGPHALVGLVTENPLAVHSVRILRALRYLNMRKCACGAAADSPVVSTAEPVAVNSEV